MRKRKEVKGLTPLIVVLSLALLAGCGSGGGDGSMDSPGSQWPVSIQGVTAVGTDSDESGRGIATDNAGNVYVAGITDGTLPGSPVTNQGSYDLFLVKYNSAGENVWTRQMGSPNTEVVSGVAVDSGGNIYVAGRTSGTLPGSPTTYQGGTDLFLVKYNSAGDNVWTRQMGSPDSDIVSGVAVDNAGNIYVAGYTGGTLPGSPTTNQGGIDLFLVKYDSSGENVWTRQMGSPFNDTVSGVAVDTGGNIYVAGYTSSTLPGSPTTNQGSDDLFLVKYNSAGDNVWTRQKGSPDDDDALAIAVDTVGNVYVTGVRVKFFIEGDGFVLKYLPDGTGP